MIAFVALLSIYLITITMASQHHHHHHHGSEQSHIASDTFTDKNRKHWEYVLSFIYEYTISQADIIQPNCFQWDIF